MIPVNEPLLSKEAKKNVRHCLATKWLSGSGPFIEQFEHDFSQAVGTRYGVAVSNGTTALHIAFLIAGIGVGDEVIMPDLTIASCAFAALYVGARPILVDVEKDTGNIDASLIEEKITAKTKAILVVHLYGHSVDMDPILALARKHHLLVIEDAAEAHGSLYKGKPLGSLGDIATFSFYGNKIVMTGEGGMVVTNNQSFAEEARLLRDLAHKPGKRFYHEVVGYNYRLSNIQAAIGVGELQHLAEYVQKKRDMAEKYQQLLCDIPFLELPQERTYAKSVYWMYNVCVSTNSPLTRDELCTQLHEKGVDTRTYFYPLHQLPVLTKSKPPTDKQLPVTTDLSLRGFYLPSGLALTNKQITTVSQVLHEIYTPYLL